MAITQLKAILFASMLTPSLLMAQNGNAGGGNSLLNQVEELFQLVSALQAENETLRGLINNNTSAIAEIDLTDLENAVAHYDELLNGVSRTVVTVNDYRVEPSTEIEVPTLVFSGMNVQIVNDLGETGTANGAGNLIVGYNEERGISSCPDDFFQCDRRWGSHMVVIGIGNNYSAYGGLVAGGINETIGAYSTVSGGAYNVASGGNSSVSGGFNNRASGGSSSVSGGLGNEASAETSTVSGGEENIASGPRSSVSGGLLNEASAVTSTVSGGQANGASGERSSVSGGKGNNASGYGSSVSGGDSNTASSNYASVTGGSSNKASGEVSSVSGGEANSATGFASSVSGGVGNAASGIYCVEGSDPTTDC